MQWASLFSIYMFGYINKAEIHCASHAAFDFLDTDRDGKFTKAEYMKGFDLFAADGDSYITKAEFNGRVLTPPSVSLWALLHRSFAKRGSAPDCGCNQFDPCNIFVLDDQLTYTQVVAGTLRILSSQSNSPALA